MLEISIEKRFEKFELKPRFSASKGFTVLFGPSGAGKSLTLQVIAGTIRPDAGRLTIDGETLFDSESGLNVPPQRRHIGYVPQNYGLFPHLTAAQNIAFGLDGREDKQARVAEMIATMGLGGFEKRKPRQLSGGQQQRVALARALAFRPRLLLLDEPFSSLDAMIRQSLRQEVLEVTQRWQTDTLLVTHDMAEAYTLGSRIVVMDAGRVLQEGDRDDVFYRPDSRRVAELVGTRNILRATVTVVDSGGLRLNWRGHELCADGRDVRPGDEVNVCIRPTQVMIVRKDRPSNRPPENELPAHIVSEAIQGENYVLHLGVGESSEGQDLEVELPGYVYYRLGLDANKEIFISLRRSSLHVIRSG